MFCNKDIGRHINILLVRILTLHMRSSIYANMNQLDRPQQCRIVAALVEGNSIRSIERMTGIHRDTIMRLAVRIGDGCDRLMDGMMRGLVCERLQLDEIWAYVGMKQKTARLLDKEFYCAVKLVTLD